MDFAKCLYDVYISHIYFYVTFRKLEIATMR